MLKLILVRHGETLWNREGRFQGKQNAPLSILGTKQAQLLAKRLAGEEFDAIYTSGLRRALETAKIIAKGHSETPIEVREELNERDHGILEGLTFEEVQADPQLEPILDSGRWRDKEFRFSEGESKADLERRLRPFLDKLIRRHQKGCILLVCHGGVAKVALRYLLDLDHEELSGVTLENASVSILNLEEGEAELQLLNDVTHLQRERQTP